MRHWRPGTSHGARSRIGTSSTVSFVATMFVLFPAWILGASGHPPQVGGASRVAAFVLLATGFALMVWCWSSFTVHGRGTPAPFDPPRQLVIRGPYRYVRNPMYIAGILVLLGDAVLFASIPLLVYAAVFWVGAHLLVIGGMKSGRSHGASTAATTPIASR